MYLKGILATVIAIKYRIFCSIIYIEYNFNMYYIETIYIIII